MKVSSPNHAVPTLLLETPPPLPIQEEAWRPQSQSGRFEAERNLLPLPGNEERIVVYLAYNLGSAATTLSRRYARG